MPDKSLPFFKKIFTCDIIFPKEEMRTAIDFTQVDELARSMRSQGLLNPISVRQMGDKYELIAGFRRLKAAEINGWNEIDARVFDTTEDSALLKKAHENMFREEVNPADEANYFRIVMNKQGWKLEDLAMSIHKSPGYVKRRIELLNLPEIVLEALKDQKIVVGVAEELGKIKNAAEMERLLFFIIQNGATIETVRQWRVQYEMSSSSAPTAYDPNIKLGTDGQPIDITKPFNLLNDAGPMMAVNESVVSYRICHCCLKKVDAAEAKLLVLCPSCESAVSKSMQQA